MRLIRTVAVILAATIVSVAFGVLARIVQDHSAAGWYLANVAGVWLAVAFAFGAVAKGRAEAFVLGVVAEAAGLAGFYGYMHFGEHLHEPLHLMAFWLCCGVIAGPLFGLVGFAWRRRRSEIAGATLGTAFVGEALLLGFTRARPPAVVVLETVGGVLLAAMLLAAARWRKNQSTPH